MGECSPHAPQLGLTGDQTSTKKKKSKKSKKSKTKRQQPSAGGVAKLLELAEGAAQARALPSE